MALSLDHIFIITKPEASEADRLSEIGFIEGNANVHPGQGTSNRRFFLDGFTIELLYVSDAEEAANGAGQGLGILTRSRDVEANPFGIVVRVSGPEKAPVFPSWQYIPDYFDGKMCFYVGDNSDQFMEPLCICMPPSLPKPSSVPIEYANPGWELTALKIDVPIEKPSEALKHFAAMDRVQIEFGKPHKMTMKFNNGVADRVENLSPDLPLVLEW
jgi:hypothetical protein